MGRRPKPAPEWSIVSQHCGTITSNDVPKLMKKLLQEDFPSKIAKGLVVPKESLEKYAKGEVAMRWSVGPARVDQLESQVAELELEHLDDLTLIRDLTKRLLKEARAC